MKRLAVVLWLFVLVLWTCIWYVSSENDRYLNNDLTEQERLTAIEYFYYEPQEVPSREQIITDVYNATGKEVVITYAEVDCGSGQARVYSNSCEIESGLSNFWFALVLAHETQHCKGIIREYEANYYAIIDLWESGTPYLQWYAGYFAISVLEGNDTIVRNCWLSMWRREYEKVYRSIR